MTILSSFLLGGKRIPTLSSQNSMILEGHIEIGKGGGTTWSASLTIVSGEVIRLKDKPSETPARFLLDMRDF